MHTIREQAIVCLVASLLDADSRPLFDSLAHEAVHVLYAQKSHFVHFFVRRKRIELLSPAWKAGILPLNQHRLCSYTTIFLIIFPATIFLSECMEFLH